MKVKKNKVNKHSTSATDCKNRRTGRYSDRLLKGIQDRKRADLFSEVSSVTKKRLTVQKGLFGSGCKSKIAKRRLALPEEFLARAEQDLSRILAFARNETNSDSPAESREPSARPCCSKSLIDVSCSVTQDECSNDNSSPESIEEPVRESREELASQFYAEMKKNMNKFNDTLSALCGVDICDEITSNLQATYIVNSRRGLTPSSTHSGISTLIEDMNDNIPQPSSNGVGSTGSLNTPDISVVDLTKCSPTFSSNLPDAASPSFERRNPLFPSDPDSPVMDIESPDERNLNAFEFLQKCEQRSAITKRRKLVDMPKSSQSNVFDIFHTLSSSSNYSASTEEHHSQNNIQRDSSSLLITDFDSHLISENVSCVRESLPYSQLQYNVRQPLPQEKPNSIDFLESLQLVNTRSTAASSNYPETSQRTVGINYSSGFDRSLPYNYSEHYNTRGMSNYDTMNIRSSIPGTTTSSISQPLNLSSSQSDVPVHSISSSDPFASLHQSVSNRIAGELHEAPVVTQPHLSRNVNDLSLGSTSYNLLEMNPYVFKLFASPERKFYRRKLY